VSLFCCPDDSLPLRSTVGGCSSLSGLILLSSRILRSALDRMWVPLLRWLYFFVLTTPSLYARQGVSAPRSLALFRCPHDSFILRSTESECFSLASFFSLSSQLPRSALDRQ
jgi:hypothetical protein